MAISVELFNDQIRDLDINTLDVVCNILLRLVDIDLEDDAEMRGDLNHSNVYLTIDLGFNPKLQKTMKQKLSHLSGYKKVRENDPILFNDISCAICRDNFKSREYKRTLDKCQHTFHKRCIDNYFYKYSDNMECPLCRVSYSNQI